MLTRFLPIILLFTCLVALAETVAAGTDLIVNGGFENGVEGWTPLWTREENTGKAVIDKKGRHNGTRGRSGSGIPAGKTGAWGRTGSRIRAER